MTRRAPIPRLLLLNTVLALCYFASGKAGLWFAQVNPSATAIWPNTGIAIAAFLLLGNECWPAILVGAFFVNFTTTGMVATSVGIAAGNTLEGFAGGWLISRLAGGTNVFNRAVDTFRFAAIGGAATIISATCGTTTLALGGLAAWGEFGSVWLTWWLGDLAGALLFAPLIIVWWTSPRVRLTFQQRLESVAVFGVLIATGVLVFGDRAAMPHGALEFICLPPLVWIAFRFGPREAATALTALSGIATWGTLRGYGPFATTGSNYDELVLQSFMITGAVTTMVVAALVSDQKRIERDRLQLLDTAQRAQAAAESANVAKDHFLAMLGHELRNPLAAISMAVHFTKRSSLANAESASAHEVIERQVEHLARLVDDLLEASRVATGKLSMNLTAVDLAGVAAECLESVRSSGRASGHNVEFTASPAWIHGDATRLGQVIANLLGNALKFTPPGGTVRVRIDHEPASGNATRTVVLSVSDTGVGLEAELLPRIFDLFVQGVESPTQAPGGLGVGLTLVKRLVELHGGAMTAESDGRNRGATFTARFPEAEPPAILPATRNEPLPGGRGGRRVLIVEDQPDVRQMLRLALEGLGHDVVEAGNGQDALSAAERFEPHVAVVDIGLPVMDGYEVARRLRTAKSGREIRLVALTGYGDLHTRAEAETAGFDFYLIKPVNLDRLGDLLVS